MSKQHLLHTLLSFIVMWCHRNVTLFLTHMYSVYNVIFFSGIIVVVIIINIGCFVCVFCAVVLYIHGNGSVSILIIISLC